MEFIFDKPVDSVMLAIAKLSFMIRRDLDYGMIDNSANFRCSFTNDPEAKEKDQRGCDLDVHYSPGPHLRPIMRPILKCEIRHKQGMYQGADCRQVAN
jgi:hypothetical protein